MKIVGPFRLRWFFFNQSIGTVETNTFQLKFLIEHENCGRHRVKDYTSFVKKYVTGRRKRFRPHKVYIFSIRITSRVDLAMSVFSSVCPPVRPYERCDLGTIKAKNILPT